MIEVTLCGPPEDEMDLGAESGLLAEPVGPNLYRLLDSPIGQYASFGDVIEVEKQPDGTLRFIRIATPSGLERSCWSVEQKHIDSPQFQALMEEIVAVDGNWELIWGGNLVLHIPKSHQTRILFGLIRFLRKNP